ncbi:MAG: hypothetical protein J2P45_11650 [Candidatus Dormibacteraeota bacterium]|nr:hypothetical protein [Candidatus Dormibacteraeota bacterium]
MAPALLLAVLAPLVGEYLLGDLSVRRLPLVLALVPQYGCGALLVRELARRTGRGWPSMLLLAGAYGLIEEGFTTQSLFNPDYLGAGLLHYGYLPTLHTSLNWAVFVISIHVVWTISTPILIAEGVAGERRATPWLRRPGLAVAAILFVLGCAFNTLSSLRSSSFVASPVELAVVAALVAGAVAAAFGLFPPGARQPAIAGRAPAPWLVGLCALVLASLFLLLNHRRSAASGLPPVWDLMAILACGAIAVLLVTVWSRRSGWGPPHQLALAAAAVLAYSWSSLATLLSGHTNLGAAVGPVDVAGQVLLALGILALIAWAAVRSRPTARPRSYAGRLSP